jgi:urease accessory protein
VIAAAPQHVLAPALAPPPAWGSGRLAVARVNGRSTVVSAWARAPLVLRTPRVRGDAAWAFVGSLGGGLVQGDALSLQVDVGTDAAAVVTTQASQKVYRGARGAAQRTTARVAGGALLVWRPDPVACFAAARYSQEARVELLDETASLVYEDVLTCGRRAMGERWDFARYASRLVVERAGRAALVDGVLLDAAHGSVAARMGRWDVMATVVALGKRAEPVARAMLAAHGTRSSRVAVAASAVPGGAIARVLAESVEALAPFTFRKHPPL